MRGYFNEDEDPDFEPEYDGDDDMCHDCQRIGSMMATCGVCGSDMCPACYEMGCGVCKGPHK